MLQKISKTASNVANKTKSNKLKDMMEKTEAVVKGMRILPTSKIHVYWDIFCLSAITYYSMSCPIRLASFINSGGIKQGFSMSFLLDYVLDFFFFVDVFLRMNVYAYVSYESGRNEVVLDREMMAKNYLGSHWFRVDIISIIPYDLISLATGYYSLYRIPKVVRTLQIPSIVSRLQRNLDECMQITMNETRVSTLKMFLASILIIVWSSAGWNAVRVEETAYESVYWAFTTLTTVGYGDITPLNFLETCYALFVGAIGATFSAAIIANVTSFFHDIDVSEDNVDHKLHCIKVRQLNFYFMIYYRLLILKAFLWLQLAALHGTAKKLI